MVKKCPTIQIDKSIASIGFVDPEICGTIISSANSDVAVAVTQTEEPTKIECEGVGDKDSDFEMSMTQFMTRVNDGKLTTEKVVREGNGYATTKREQDAADAKDASNAKILEKYISSMIKSKE
jgi:hypothetical protein